MDFNSWARLESLGVQSIAKFCRGAVHVKNPATRNRTRDHLISATLYSQMLYQLSYSRLCIIDSLNHPSTRTLEAPWTLNLHSTFTHWPDLWPPDRLRPGELTENVVFTHREHTDRPTDPRTRISPGRAKPLYLLRLGAICRPPMGVSDLRWDLRWPELGRDRALTGGSGLGSSTVGPPSICRRPGSARRSVPWRYFPTESFAFTHRAAAAAASAAHSVYR